MARWGSGRNAKRLRRSGEDATGLVIDYVKQETVEPVKALGRFVAYGLAGSLLIAVGLVLLLVAVLRLLQTETSAFSGNLSWLPYLIVIALALALAVLAAWRITAGPARRRNPVKPGKR